MRKILHAHNGCINPFVVPVFATFVWALDTTSGRSVIAGNRQTDSGTVTEVDRLLYKSLAERASSDNCSPIVVLDSSGENLAGRSGTFVNEYDEWHFLATACAVSKFFCTGIFTALRIYYQFSFRQEFVYHADSCFHIPPCYHAGR